MKYQLGQQVKINKDNIIGFKLGEVGIITQIFFEDKKYEVYIRNPKSIKQYHIFAEEHLDDTTIKQYHIFAEEHLDAPNKISKSDIETAKKIVKYINDFNVQVNKAHGLSWNVEDLEKISALDLILHLYPNNVKFRYIGDYDE